MKRRSIVLSAALLLLVLGGGAWLLYPVLWPAAAPPAPAPLPAQGARVDTVGGETVVVLPADMQRAAGITVAPLAAAAVRQELGYASVIDPQPLFDLGARLAAARAERDAARAQAGASAAQAARTRTLFEDDRNASQKDVQDARAAAGADAAKLAASQAALAGIEADLRQQFGAALARAAASPGSKPWRQLVAGQAAVLRVVLPAGGAAPDSVTVDAQAGAELAARKLSAAPQVDPMLQGAAWFYLVERALPAGTRTVARAARGETGADGVLVPDTAIVWYGDTRWTYVRIAKERFARRLVQAVAPAEDGIVAAGGLHPGDTVVTRGAALLLSEELRPRGIATQCKDPPECDD